jgi:hypothetical protein
VSGKPSDDVHEALRNCVVHIRQTNDAIVEADRQRTDAITEGDLDVVRRVNKRLGARLRSWPAPSGLRWPMRRSRQSGPRWRS